MGQNQKDRKLIFKFDGKKTLRKYVVECKRKDSKRKSSEQEKVSSKKQKKSKKFVTKEEVKKILNEILAKQETVTMSLLDNYVKKTTDDMKTMFKESVGSCCTETALPKNIQMLLDELNEPLICNVESIWSKMSYEDQMTWLEGHADRDITWDDIILDEVNENNEEMFPIETNEADHKDKKLVGIKMEKDYDEYYFTKPVNIFSSSSSSEPQPSTSTVKIITDPMPCCSKKPIKAELKADKDCSIEIKKVLIPGLDIADEFKNMGKNMMDINKWMGKMRQDHGFKDSKVLEIMLQRNNLYCLFKCMSAKCCYASSSYDNFLQHLNAHKARNYFIKDYFLNCPYCFYQAAGPIDLVEHYRNQHHNCLYQCSLCFYRSAEKQSVYDHQQEYHNSEKSRHQILECPKVFPNAECLDEQRASSKVENIQKDLECKICSKQFILPENFISHLDNEHTEDHELVAVMNQKDHMQKKIINNKVGKYQCIECRDHSPFGSNNRIEMRTHLQKHPKRLHYVCVRGEEKFSVQKIPSRKDIQVKPYIGELKTLENSEGVEKTSIEEFTY